MDLRMLLVLSLGVASLVSGSEMEESETADSHVIHSLHPPVSAGLYGLPYNPIIYPPYGYPGYPDTTGPAFRTPYDVTHDGDINPHLLHLSPEPRHLQHPPHPEHPILPGHHLKNYIPYQYDIHKIPECAFPNKQYYNITFCLQDDYYPVDTIKHELERNKPLVDRILSDITYQSADNLVEGLTKLEEEGYNYAHYYGAGSQKTYNADYNGYSYAKDYYKDGGYLCPSDIFYGRPKRAANTYGKWKVIVNLPDEYYAKGFGVGYERYTQTQRLEQCMYPGAPCSYLDPHFPSHCVQKHNFVRLLAYTYEEGLHIDSFKLPIACSCHIPPLHPFSGAYPGPSPSPRSHHWPSPATIVAFGKK